MKKHIYIIATILCLCIFPTHALAAQDIDSAINTTADFIEQTVSSPSVSSIGGEWSVIAFARCNTDEYDDFLNTYIENLKTVLDENDGILHHNRLTEYSRVILAITALGEDASNFYGYDLVSEISDLSKVKLQGVNGCIYALLAIDSGNYNIASDATATRSALINEILASQKSDGGFSLSDTSDVDITAAALQALSKYDQIPEVSSSIDMALNYLSSVQLSNGGFLGWGGPNSESTSQVIIALCELGIDIDDPRFIKNGFSALDCLLAAQNQDGGFVHTSEDGVSNLMATEQVLCALVSIELNQSNNSSLYNMSDNTELSICQNTPLTSKWVWESFNKFTDKLFNS